MRRAFRLTALFVATLAFATACKTSTTGEANTLNFAYEDPDNLLTRALDAPIAVGTQVRLKVRAADRKGKAQLSAATVDGAAKLIGFEGDEVIIEGVSAGLATVVVQSDLGEDSVAIEIAETESVSLRRINQAERVLVGGTEPLGVERRGGGELLVGEAPLTGVSVTDGVVEQVAGPAHRVTVRYLTEGTAEIAVAESTLTRVVVGLDVVEILEAETLGEKGPVGETLLGYIQAKDAAGQPVGALGGLVEATVADESICAYRPGEAFGIEGAQVELLSVGTCVIDLALGTHTAQWRIEVEPAAESEGE